MTVAITDVPIGNELANEIVVTLEMSGPVHQVADYEAEVHERRGDRNPDGRDE